MTPYTHPPVLFGRSADDAPIWARLDRLCDALAATAAERDQAGGHAAAERELIRASGLLNLTTPRALGGEEVNWQTFYRTLRQVAEVDSALAHLYAFHHLQVITIRLFGTPAQQARLLSDTASRGLFWGNALNPSDRRTIATPVEGGYRIDGPKSYCSGSVGSDRMTVSAWHEPSQSFLIGVVDTRAAGVTVVADWNAFGQKQTDSGTVHFDRVIIPDDDVLIAPGQPATPWTTLRAQFAQHVLGSLYVGLATGALRAGLAYTRERTRAWAASGVARAVDDPYTQLRYADLWLLVRTAAVLSDAASARLDEAFGQGHALQAAQRGEVAVAVAEAKIAAHRAAMAVSSGFFEQTGAGATSQTLALDRFWRNARVHTLHDPIDYKLRDIGRYVLEGRYPEPTSYS